MQGILPAMLRAHFLAICLIGSSSALAQISAPPAAPSNLRVVALGVNAFQLTWRDNSNNEKGWDIRASIGKTSKPARYELVATPNLKSYTVITNELPGQTLSFQVAAYNGGGRSRTFSTPTSVVRTVALKTSTFAAPSEMTASTIDDGTIRLSWKDAATSEHGYQVQIKRGNGSWQDYGNAGAGTTFSLPIFGFDPLTRYSFRTRAFKGNPAVFTAYSNVASATTRPFLAPEMLVPKAAGEGAISFQWKDRSSIESGYEIQWRSGTGNFQSLGTVGTNVTSTTPITGFSLRTDYEFRLRAFRIVGSAKAYSAFSNSATIRTSALIKPTQFAGQVTGDSSVRLTWNDASALESGYQIEYRETGATTFTSLGVVAADVEAYNATGLTPGQTYDFRVIAFLDDGFSTTSYSEPTAAVPLTTRNGFTSDLHPAIFWNTSFEYEIEVSHPDLLSSVTVTGLPSGLAYDATLRTISGIPLVEGARTVNMTANYTGGYSVTRPLVLRIIRAPAPPEVTGEFSPVVVAAGASSTVSASARFSDPDSPAARRVTTSKGNFNIILYSDATPLTVANFLQYADGGRYHQSFFHRSVADFIIQGGGYRYDDASGFRKVQALAAVRNEAGISNVTGTVAMAKVAGNPDSATSEFFVNVDDANAPNLDNQNGGFTVFGRIAGEGMNIVNQINALPSDDYSLSVSGENQYLEGVPMDASSAPDILDPDLLVKVVSVAPIAVLSYQATSSNTAVATVSVQGTNVVITGVTSGTATIEVKATDLDGNTVSRNIEVTVP